LLSSLSDDFGKVRDVVDIDLDRGLPGYRDVAGRISREKLIVAKGTRTASMISASPMGHGFDACPLHDRGCALPGRLISACFVAGLAWQRILHFGL
jgi:hypothetical protein